MTNLANLDHNASRHQLLTICRTLLETRRAEVRNAENKGSPSLYVVPNTMVSKRFSEAELLEETGVDLGYIRTKAKRLPPSDVIMAVADYLECSILERNQLLAAAQYNPIEPRLEGPLLKKALDVCKTALHGLPHALPYYILNRDWAILDWSPTMLTLFGLEKAYVASVPQEKFNLLWLLFDPSLPIRQALEAVSLDSWQQMAMRNIWGFKFDTRFCTRESWYCALIDNLNTLPDFEDIFAIAQPADYTQTLEYVTTYRRAEGQITVRTLALRLGDFAYPQPSLFSPVDSHTRMVFEHLGLTSPQW